MWFNFLNNFIHSTRNTTTVDASDVPPRQTKSATENRHIPAEIVEEILLNLPVKSLLRFSSVSKSWNSMIFAPRFVKKYRGDERIVLNRKFSDDLNEFSCCPVSDILSDNSVKHATNLVCPFGQRTCNNDFIRPLRIRAFCDELWFVENKNDKSLFLWNPSMRTYRQLHDPLLPRNRSFFYGLGYDSVGDDYKILKILNSTRHEREAVLYSLRSDSWRKIKPFPERNISRFSLFASGALHWLCRTSESSYVVISFDLSTEKYGEVALPEYSPTLDSSDKMKVVVLSGKLCLCLSYTTTNNFSLWVMEDYGVVESWTKKFDIDCNSIPFFGSNYSLRPLYFCDNGQIQIVVFRHLKETVAIYMYKDDKITLTRKIYGRSQYRNISEGLVYVESLVSPAMWPTSAALVSKNEA